MKIAVVRGGTFFHTMDLNLFAPLLTRHQFQFYVARSVRRDIGPYNVPIEALPWIGTTIAPRWLGALVAKAVHRLSGNGYALQGLVPRLQDAEIVHTNECVFTYSWQAIQAKRRYGTKVVVTVLENIPMPFEQFRWCAAPIERLRARVLAEADAFITVSTAASDLLRLQGVPASKIHYIPYGVDLAHFTPGPADAQLRDRWQLHQERLVVLFVGRWVWSKGVYDLLYALQHLRHTHAPPIHALFVGSGVEARRMRQMVAACGLTDVVRWGGPQPYAQMPAIYRLADLVVLPTLPTPHWQEQFGMAMVEAMAMGKALLTTSSGVIPEVVGDAAILVPPGDYRALATQMRAMLEDADARHRWGLKGRQRAESHYDAQRRAEQLDAVYQSCRRPA